MKKMNELISLLIGGMFLVGCGEKVTETVTAYVLMDEAKQGEYMEVISNDPKMRVSMIDYLNKNEEANEMM
jgi:PBP1b-binding outer membrane lipoprotein LpoB